MIQRLGMFRYSMSITSLSPILDSWSTTYESVSMCLSPDQISFNWRFSVLLIPILWKAFQMTREMQLAWWEDFDLEPLLFSFSWTNHEHYFFIQFSAGSLLTGMFYFVTELGMWEECNYRHEYTHRICQCNPCCPTFHLHWEPVFSRVII